MKLRKYQQEAVNAVISHIKKSTLSCCIKLPTASGKSVIYSELVHSIVKLSGKKVLGLVPTKELLLQNKEKLTRNGEKVSVFSASLGKKCTINDIVIGTPKSINNAIKKDPAKFGKAYSAVIIDEAQDTSPTMRNILKSMREHNPNLRVIGMTATPYRTNMGYIYKHHYKTGSPPNASIYSGDNPGLLPLYDTLVYDVTENELIENGYITPPIFGDIENLHYETSELKLKSNGKFDQNELDKVFKGKGRLTSEIVADFVSKSTGRKAVLVFASSIEHATEIRESLPYDNSDIVTGKTPKAEREEMIKSFLNGEIRYLINVGILTTGFDFPALDTVAILRATESPALLLQMVGRAVRLAPHKVEGLILDYGENLERHCANDDIFSPIIKARGGGTKGQLIDVICPDCSHTNQFTLNEKFEEMPYNEQGNLIAPDGAEILHSETETPIAVHYGQRCKGVSLTPRALVKCNHRWNSKECPSCGAHNSLSARNCTECLAELIDPNEKLTLDAPNANNPADWHEYHAKDCIINPKSATGSSRIDWHCVGDNGRTISTFINPFADNRFYAMSSNKQLNIITDNCEKLINANVKRTSLAQSVKASQKPQFFALDIKLKFRKKGDFYEIK